MIRRDETTTAIEPNLLADPDAGAVVSAWRTVFGSRVLNGEADFFEIGGDSLWAILLIERLADECGVEVGLDFVFDYPTLTEQIREMRRLRTA